MSEMLGRVYALSDAKEQAEFLNEVGRVMRTWKEPAAMEMQLFRIGDSLNEHGRQFVRRLFENINTDAP